jgi:N-acyl-D-aspartate/D-glutamate deacylase
MGGEWESEVPGEFDTVISSGMIVDGLRTPRFVSDIGIRDGRIAYIGRIFETGRAEVIDAEGLIVAPGFVDLHTHYDSQVFWDPYCTIGGWHGITSNVIGNCGFSFAPCRPEHRERIMRMMERNEAVPWEAMNQGMPWDWETLPEFLDSLERTPKGVNLLSYVGIAPMIAYAMGGVEEAKRRRPSESERAHIRQMFHEALDAGACGFSLQYFGPNHSQQDYDGTPFLTDTLHFDEVLLFAEVLRERRMGFIQILCPDLEKVEKLAEVSGRPIIYNVLAASRDQHGMSTNAHRDTIDWLKRCNDRGLRLFASAITSEVGHTFSLDNWNFFDGIDSWREALIGTVADKQRKLADPTRRQRFREEYDKGWGPFPGASQRVFESLGAVKKATMFSCVEDMIIGHTASAQWKDFTGLTVGEAAAKTGRHVIDAFLDIALADGLKAEFETPPTRYNPQDMKEVVTADTAMPGVSDGGAHQKFSTFGAYPTTFLTEMVREHRMVDLEEAHWKLSALPAYAAGLADRGFLREGMPADIVIYDFDALEMGPVEIVHDFPGGDWRPIRKAKGYRRILVNGVTTFIDGECTGKTPGRLLRWGRADPHPLPVTAE